MANSSREKWEIETIRQILKQSKITAQPGNEQKLFDPWELPHNQVWEYSPAAAVDERFPFPLQIAGPEPFIGLQVSLGKWLHDCLGRRLGYLVTFEDFWEQWSEKGFSWAINRTGTTGLTTNYPFRDVEHSDGSTTPGWRKNRDTRPGYLEWKNPHKKNNPYYRIIEYWPNRSRKKESYVLIGSDLEIIRHIVAIEYQPKNNISNFTYSHTSVNRAKYPLIQLVFRTLTDENTLGRHFYKWRLRLIGKTVTNINLQSFIDHQALALAEIKNYARRIVKVFNVDQPELTNRFSFRRGKKLFTYKDSNGLHNKGCCFNENEAKKLVATFCAILEV